MRQIYLVCDEASLIGEDFHETYDAYVNVKEARTAMKELAREFIKDCVNCEFTEFQDGFTVTMEDDYIEIKSTKDEQYNDIYFIKTVYLYSEDTEDSSSTFDVKECSVPRLGHPKYQVGDKVMFVLQDKEYIGNIYIVDEYGTFGQKEEPSYDIMLTDEEHPNGVLYKHIRESLVCKKLTD